VDEPLKKAAWGKPIERFLVERFSPDVDGVYICGQDPVAPVAAVESTPQSPGSIAVGAFLRFGPVAPLLRFSSLTETLFPDCGKNFPTSVSGASSPGQKVY
jgi:hypothetical protein